MSISRWEEYKLKNGTTPLDALNPKSKKVDDALFETRFNLCMNCPELIKFTKQCKRCGCFMEVKSKIEASKCPLGKW